MGEKREWGNEIVWEEREYGGKEREFGGKERESKGEKCEYGDKRKRMGKRLRLW